MAADRSMPVLVVDDYNTMIRIIRNLLKQIGFSDIDDAADGSAALARMREKKYGLVISDWNMEPMTGYELLKEVRADPGLSKTPFIMVTAESKTENVIAAKKAGVNNYIVKPFNAQTLQSKIEAVFPDLSGPARSTANARPGAGRCIFGSPHQPPHHRLGKDLRAGEDRLQQPGIGSLPPAQLLGVDAGGDEQAIDSERSRAGEVGAHR